MEVDVVTGILKSTWRHKVLMSMPLVLISCASENRENQTFSEAQKLQKEESIDEELFGL